MMAAASCPSEGSVTLEQELGKEGFLASNVEALGLPSTTRREVLSAEPRGRVVHTVDRTPLLESNGRLLGTPFGDDEVLRVARESGEGTAFIVFGLGMGHVVRALREHSPHPIVVYEPDAGLLRTVLSHGPADLGGTLVITNLHDLPGAWTQIGLDRQVGVLVPSPGYREAYPEQLGAVGPALGDLFQRIGITRNTYEARAKIWVEDIIANLEVVAGTSPFLSLAGQYRGVPAFIVGAGPSLDKNAHLVAEAGKKGIVFSVNSSSKALARHGITPHVLACIESLDSSHLLAGLPFIDDVVRAFSLAAAPGILRTGKGPLLPFHEALPQLGGPVQGLLGVPGVAVCGSVSTAVFSLAHALGCNPIVFLGQDLAYTGGRTHAGGSFWEESRAKVCAETGQIELAWSETLKQVGHRSSSEPVIELPAWGGEGTVISGPTFTGIRTWLEASATLLAQQSPEVRLVNATEGGARLHGFEECRLRDVLDGLPEVGITPRDLATQASARRAPLTRAEIARWANHQAELADTVRRSARRMRRVAEHTLLALRGESSGSVWKAFGALDVAEEAMRRAVHAAPLVDLYAHDVIHVAAHPRDSSETTADARGDALRSTERGVGVARVVERESTNLAARFREAARSLRE